MKVEMVSIGSVKFDEHNVRQHNKEGLAAIKSSLKRFGQQKPIVVDADGVVRAGNGTLEAAIQLGWTKIAVVRSKLSGNDATAYAIADNRSSDLSVFDHEGLSETLRQLAEDDTSLVLDAGFTERDMGALSKLLNNDQTDETTNAEEINVDGFELKSKCPRCGFEFNEKA